MALIFKILFIYSAYLPNSYIPAHAETFFISDLSNSGLIINIFEENNPDTTLQFFENGQLNKTKPTTKNINIHKESDFNNIFISFLQRLTPLLIDVPPPAIFLV